MPAYIIFALVFGILSAVAETLVMVFCFDFDKGVFKQGDIFGTLIGVLIFLGIIVVISAIPAVGSGSELSFSELPPCTAIEAFFAAMAGCFIAAYSLMNVISIITSASKTPNGVVLKYLFKGTPNTILLLMLIVSVPSAVYLIRSAILKKSTDKALAILGFFPVIWVAFCLLKIYFDRTSALNDPTKILSQIALASIMLFFLMELRVRVGKAHLGYYCASACSAFILGITYSVSMIVAGFAGANGLATDKMLCLTVFCGALYALSRAASVLSSLGLSSKKNDKKTAVNSSASDKA